MRCGGGVIATSRVCNITQKLTPPCAMQVASKYYSSWLHAIWHHMCHTICSRHQLGNCYSWYRVQFKALSWTWFKLHALQLICTPQSKLGYNPEDLDIVLCMLSNTIWHNKKNTKILQCKNLQKNSYIISWWKQTRLNLLNSCHSSNPDN